MLHYKGLQIRRLFLATLLSILSLSIYAKSQCDFKKSRYYNYQGKNILKHSKKGPYIFVANKVHKVTKINLEVKVDADGAPNAYHPDDVGLYHSTYCTTRGSFKGLDCPGNAGYYKDRKSSNWRSVIVPDPKDNSKGYVQPSGQFQGYFVSQTSLRDDTKSDLDPDKYVDARLIPYFVFPTNFFEKKGTGLVGDYGFAINMVSGESSSFIVADVGGSNKLGEMSIALAAALGGENPNPINGGSVPKGKIAYIIFPYTKATPKWPVEKNDMNEKVTALLTSVGGVEMLKACAKTL